MAFKKISRNNLQIYQPKNGYCYNSDTLFLYDFCLRFLKKNHKVLEIGSGSGILGMLCVRDLEVDLVMIEKNPQMAEFSYRNLEANQIAAEVICEDFLIHNFLNLKFDCVIANPPFYYQGVLKSQNSSISQARYEENLPFELMVKKLNSLLKPRGEFIFCYDAKESYKVFEILGRYKMRPVTLRYVYPREDKEATLLLCRIKKGSKSQTQVLSPLFTHQGEDFTQEVQRIYQKAKTQSIKC